MIVHTKQNLEHIQNILQATGIGITDGEETGKAYVKVNY
jgi:hypothetical protein